MADDCVAMNDSIVILCPDHAVASLLFDLVVLWNGNVLLQFSQPCIKRMHTNYCYDPY